MIQPPSPDTTDGSFGLVGILRFAVPGHSGIGVHSGQAHAHYKPGPPHPTFVCIRTTDTAAMLNITRHIYDDPLTTITVINNDHTVAVQGKRLHGGNHANH